MERLRVDFLKINDALDLFQVAIAEESGRSSVDAEEFAKAEKFCTSDDFLQQYLKSDNVFLRNNTEKLCAVYLAGFAEEDYIHRVLSEIRSFTLLERIFSSFVSKNSPKICKILPYLRLACRNLAKNDEISLFRTLHNLLSIHSPSHVIADEIVSHWPDYSALFETSAAESSPLVETLSANSSIACSSSATENSRSYWSCRYRLTILNEILTVFLHRIAYNQQAEDSAVSSDAIAAVSTSADDLCKFYNDPYSQNLHNLPQKRWFGGLDDQSNSNDPVDPCVQRLLILTLIKSRAFIQRVSSDDESLVTWQSAKLDCKRAIALFLDQDDQLCEFLYCNLLMHEMTHWNYHELMLNLLRAINWTNDILLDWTISAETCFLPYFTRYLKITRNDPRAFLTIAKELAAAEDSATTTEECEPADYSGANSEELRLKIHEIIGNEPMTKTVVVRPLKKRPTANAAEESAGIPPAKIRRVDISGRFFDVLVGLSRKLTKLNDKRLLPFNGDYLIKSIDCTLLVLRTVVNNM